MLDGLEQAGLLSEARFAEQYVRQRGAKGYGPVRIRAELQQRGIAPSEIQRALAEAEVPWEEQLHRLIQRKYGHPLPSDRQELARVQRALHQRGFTEAMIRQALAGGEA
jgi:regulatory protein